MNDLHTKTVLFANSALHKVNDPNMKHLLHCKTILQEQPTKLTCRSTADSYPSYPPTATHHTYLKQIIVLFSTLTQ